MQFGGSNYLIDVIDQFRALDNDEARWTVAQTLITDLGGSALNIV